MKSRDRSTSAAVLFILMSGVRAQSLRESPVPPDSEIRRILADRIDGVWKGVGIVVGVIEPKGTRVVAYGSLDKGGKRPVGGDTIFEIGSVTEVFTSLLLADMVKRGEVALADPVAKYLPEGVKVPERGGRRITLEDLATHTSGLPRLPSNLKPANPANPYADYSEERLYEFLSTYKMWRDVGSGFEYSNLGGGLLGHALARRAGMSYEALVTSRIAQPLHMRSTGITLSAEMKARLAVGHNDRLAAVPNFDYQALAGTGALRSTANDLLVFVAANLGYAKSPLAPAMAAMLKVRRPTTIPGTEMASAGW
jgi:CubicO group peptidase (beta-lactamase class C family)